MNDMPIENVRTMRDEDLWALYNELRAETERRKNVEKEEDWLAVREAVTNYIRKWGGITASDDGYDIIDITNSVKMDTIGVMKM